MCFWGEREGEEKRRKERMRERMCAFWARKGEKDVWFLGGVHLTRTHSLSQRARVCVCARTHTSVRELFFARVRSVSREQVPSLSYISFRFRKVPGKVKFVNLKIHELHLTSHLDLERSLAITHVNY